MKTLEDLTAAFSSFAWGLPLLILLVGGGLYLLIRSQFLPFRYLGHAISVLRGKYDNPDDAGEISHFKALTTALSSTIIQDVRHEIGAVAAFRDVLVVKRLPKTRSGKILRKLLRNISDDLEYNVPSTIDDVVIISEIESVYKKKQLGIHKNIISHE
jgi:hypothetical protein